MKIIKRKFKTTSSERERGINKFYSKLFFREQIEFYIYNKVEYTTLRYICIIPSR